jgi:hypothetical protein
MKPHLTRWESNSGWLSGWRGRFRSCAAVLLQLGAILEVVGRKGMLRRGAARDSLRKALMSRSFRVTEAFAVATIELAGALFVNWVRLVGLAIGLRARGRICVSGNIMFGVVDGS